MNRPCAWHRLRTRIDCKAQRLKEFALQTITYGACADQAGDLHLPQTRRHDASSASVVCLLHGGFWRMPHGRDQMDAVAHDLTTRGFAVWNLGYRRLGAPEGGWPGTLDDVVAGIDHLATLADDGIAIDTQRVIVVGHSAGGHLALWCAHRDADGSYAHRPRRVRAVAVAGLAPVADLALADALGVGSDAVAELLGGSFAEQRGLYRMASPMAMLPLGVPQLIIHGSADDVLPVALSLGYASAASAAGDNVRFVALAGAGHMDFLDPSSEAHAVLCSWLDGF